MISETIRQIREQISQLEGGSRAMDNYLNHELRRCYVVRTSFDTVRALGGEEFRDLPKINNFSSSDGKINREALYMILDAGAVVNLDGLEYPENEEGIWSDIKKDLRLAPDLKDIFPALETSRNFFHDPTEKSYQTLRDQSASLASVLRVALSNPDFRIPDGFEEGFLLNGPETVMIMNIVSNAEKHGMGESEIERVGSGIRVRNWSTEALASGYGQFALPRERPKRLSFGSFFIRTLAMLEGIDLVTESVPSEGKSGLHRISVSLSPLVAASAPMNLNVCSTNL